MPSDNPLVSIVIPVYNGEKYVHEAIDSVLAQTYPHIELIVVNDGATDRTPDILNSYKERICIINKENGGVATALNAGIQNAKGEYIGWLSHDDLFLPKKIESQIRFLLTHPNFEICYSDYAISGPDGNIIKNVNTAWYPRDQIIKHMFGGVYIHGSTIFLRKSCFDVVGLFNREYPNTQDVDMWIRLSECYEMGRVPEVLMISRRHAKQGSRNYAYQLACEQSFFSETYLNIGAVKILPELAKIKDRNKVIAAGYEWLGDTMLYKRQWLKFAIESYTQSANISPSLNIIVLIKKLFAWLLMQMMGEEAVTLIRIQEAVFLKKIGKRSDAQRILFGIIKEFPLHLEAIFLWFSYCLR